MEKDKKTNDMEDTMTIYEVSYLLLPSLATEQVPARVASLHDVIEKAGGQVISGENGTLIDLAYPMTKVVQTLRHKCLQGYFGWVKFELSKDGIKEIKKFLDGHAEVLRYLIIKSVRENTLVNGKMLFKKEEIIKKEVEVSESEDGVSEEPTSPEEVDKSIDELVIN